MRIIDAIDFATKSLKKRGISTPRLDAEAILAHVLECERIDLYRRPQGWIDKNKVFLYRRLIERRGLNEPVAYITGQKEFMGFKFNVDKRVLIPRPETELLVERVMDVVSTIRNPWILDVGCGCGAIIISLARMMEGVFFGVDVSLDALEVARENAKKLCVSNKVSFFLCTTSKLKDVKEIKGRLDAIVSNPPYIPTESLDSLPDDVKWEPRLALNGGKDGLDVICGIIEGGVGCLKSGGILAVEFDPPQASKIIRLLERSGQFSPPDLFEDLQGMKRFFLVTKK
jgi:release factor glutamine methyltransferase